MPSIGITPSSTSLPSTIYLPCATCQHLQKVDRQAMGFTIRNGISATEMW
jgi:hypothetical protein